MDDISDAVWRSEFYSPTTGAITVLLPEIGMLAGDAKDRGPSECCMAAALCYGVPIWAAAINQQVVEEVWDAQRAFGMADAEFVPFWKQKTILCSDPRIRVSLWQKPRRCLIVVANFTGEPRMIELRPTASTPEAKFQSAWNVQKFATSGGTARLTVPGRRGCLLSLTAPPR